MSASLIKKANKESKMPQIKFEVADIYSILQGNSFRGLDHLMVMGNCFGQVSGRNRSLFAIPPPRLMQSLITACPF